MKLKNRSLRRRCYAAAILGVTVVGSVLAASAALAGHPKLPPTFPPRCTTVPPEFPDPFAPVYDPDCDGLAS